MGKPAKIGIGIVIVVVLIFSGLSLFLKIFLSGDRLKAIILPKAESATGRKVELEDINVSLFRGVVAKGLSLKEKDGKGDFVKVKEFILSYQLLPLLKKQLVISKIEVVSPSISVRRYKEDRFNFSDLTEKKPSPPEKGQESEQRGLPLSLVADKLLIRDAGFSFVDEGKELPDISAHLDMEFKGGIGKEGVPRLEKGRVSLKEVKVRIKDTEVRTAGDIDIDPQVVLAKLQTSIGKEALEVNATIKDYLSAPDVRSDFHARSLDLEKWMGLGGGKKAPERVVQKREKQTPKASGASAEKLRASGRITVDEAKYQNYRIKNFRLNYLYDKGALRLEPFELSFSGGDAFTMEGVLNGAFRMMVDEVSTIQKTLNGKAVIKLGKGKIKESRIFNAIALLTGISALKNPEISEGLFNFDVKDERVSLDGLIQSGLFKLSPKGTVDFEKRIDLIPGLKISPDLTGGLAKNLASLKFMEDEQGWRLIPLKIKGTTEKPNVTVDEETLRKQLGSGLIKEVDKLIKGSTPGEGKPSQKQSPRDLLKDLFGK